MPDGDSAAPLEARSYPRLRCKCGTDALGGCKLHNATTMRLVEVERDRLRAAIEDYLLWEPGRAGHAAASRKLKEALDA